MPVRVGARRGFRRYALREMGLTIAPAPLSSTARFPSARGHVRTSLRQWEAPLRLEPRQGGWTAGVWPPPPRDAEQMTHHLLGATRRSRRIRRRVSIPFGFLSRRPESAWAPRTKTVGRRAHPSLNLCDRNRVRVPRPVRLHDHAPHGRASAALVNGGERGGRPFGDWPEVLACRRVRASSGSWSASAERRRRSGNRTRRTDVASSPEALRPARSICHRCGHADH